MSWTLVTGGAKRLGRAIALELAKDGFNVVIHYRHSEKEATECAKLCQNFGVNAEICQGDFSREEGVLEFLDRYAFKKNTSGLVNNVGTYLIKPLLQTTSKEWKELFQTNLEAPRLLSCALHPTLKWIVNMGTSGLTSLRTSDYSSAYVQAKHALWMLTRSLALEMKGVRVNMVSPGYTTLSVDEGEPKATPEEIARVVLFLAQKESSHITGQNIEVSGRF